MNANGGSPMLKKRSVSNILEIKEWLDVCDIWRIRNPKVKHFPSGHIQRRLVYIFVLQYLQKLVKTTEVLVAFSSDCSSVFCSIPTDYQNIKKGQGLWKFNNSIIENEEYVLELRHFMQELLDFLNANTQFSDQMKWE